MSIDVQVQKLDNSDIYNLYFKYGFSVGVPNEPCTFQVLIVFNVLPNILGKILLSLAKGPGCKEFIKFIKMMRKDGYS